MVYDELSRYPIEIDIKLSIISYWTKLIRGKEIKLSTIKMDKIYREYISRIWLFIYMGWSKFPARKLVKALIKQRLIYQFIQSWF